MDYVVGWLAEAYTVLILAFSILILVRNTDEVNSRTKRWLFAISILTVVLSAVDYAEGIVAELPYENMARYILSWVGYTLRPMISMFFFMIVTQHKKYSFWAFELTLLNALVYATTFVPYTHEYAFWFNEENEFQRGPLGFTSQVIGFIYIAIILIVVYRHYTENRKHNASALFFCAMATTLAVALETLSEEKIHILNETILISCLSFFVFLHTRANKEEVEEKDTLLSDQRAAMKLSQLQPRFLYKNLEVLKGLPTKDPRRAEKVINILSKYLKAQLESTNLSTPILFEDELERTKLYVDLEMARMPNLSVKYEIEATDFFIPALTMQQLVENAIEHGLENTKYAQLTIKSFASETGYTIIIQDNGKGFNGEEDLTRERQGSRFGVDNVRDRLERMVGGKLTYVSLPDAGTTAMVSIPADFE